MEFCRSGAVLAAGDTMLGVCSGNTSSLTDSGCGEGLGERGKMPRDLSAAVACKFYEHVFTRMTYRKSDI